MALLSRRSQVRSLLPAKPFLLCIDFSCVLIYAEVVWKYSNEKIMSFHSKIFILHYKKEKREIFAVEMISVRVLIICNHKFSWPFIFIY